MTTLTKVINGEIIPLTPEEETAFLAIQNAPQPTPVPQSVTMRQAQLALYEAELLDNIEALVATLPRPYQIEWQKAGTVERNNALVEIVRQQQNMTSEQIDNLFRRAAEL